MGLQSAVASVVEIEAHTFPSSVCFRHPGCTPPFQANAAREENSVMSYCYINAVRSLPLSPGLQCLAYALASRANEQGSCYPSVRTISADTGLSRSTIFAHLKTLRDKGLLRVRSQFRANGGRKSSLYTLLVDCAKKAAGAVKKALRPVGMLSLIHI